MENFKNRLKSVENYVESVDNFCEKIRKPVTFCNIPEQLLQICSIWPVDGPPQAVDSPKTVKVFHRGCKDLNMGGRTLLGVAIWDLFLYNILI